MAPRTRSVPDSPAVKDQTPRVRRTIVKKGATPTVETEPSSARAARRALRGQPSLSQGASAPPQEVQEVAGETDPHTQQQQQQQLEQGQQGLSQSQQLVSQSSRQQRSRRKRESLLVEGVRRVPKTVDSLSAAGASGTVGSVGDGMPTEEVTTPQEVGMDTEHADGVEAEAPRSSIKFEGRRRRPIVRHAGSASLAGEALNMLVSSTSQPYQVKRRQRKPWSDEEVRALEEGMAMHGQSVTRWADILGDERFAPAFADGRTNVDLKDKWRNMHEKQLLPAKSEWQLLGTSLSVQNRFPRDAALRFASQGFTHILLQRTEGAQDSDTKVLVYRGFIVVKSPPAAPRFEHLNSELDTVRVPGVAKVAVYPDWSTFVRETPDANMHRSHKQG